MLAPRVAGLIGVEIDRDLAAALTASPPPHTQIVQADFLETEVAALIRRLGDPPARVVGNLPYNVSSPILFKLMALAPLAGVPKAAHCRLNASSSQMTA